MKKIFKIELNDDIYELLKPSYLEFNKRKQTYLNNKSDDNYIELTFAYASIDADLKDLLSRNLLSLQDFRHIKEKLKEEL